MDYITESNRIYAKGENEKILAEILFPNTNDNVYTITHTFVDNSLRGKGIASKLVKMAVEQIQNQGGTVNATCSYAIKWLEKNK